MCSDCWAQNGVIKFQITGGKSGVDYSGGDIGILFYYPKVKRAKEARRRGPSNLNAQAYLLYHEESEHVLRLLGPKRHDKISNYMYLK